MGEWEVGQYKNIEKEEGTMIEDKIINGKATVYWKQSVRDLLGTVYTPAAVDEILDQPNAVGKDWNMFDF